MMKAIFTTNADPIYDDPPEQPSVLGVCGRAAILRGATLRSRQLCSAPGERT
jgi:hypothetical protein